MDWNQDRIVTAQTEASGEQDPQSDNALIERFQTFFHEFPGPSLDFPYRREIEQRRVREDFWIELDLEDLRKDRKGDLADEIKRVPSRYLPLV